VTWRISPVILVRKYRASAPAGALPVSLVLPAEFSADATGVPDALGFRLVSVIRLPAWFVFVLWILFQIIGTVEQKAGMSSVSSAAHLGGAAVGVLAWLVWRKPKDESRLLE
jgi:membrane associated rhomboid family serine protease